MLENTLEAMQEAVGGLIDIAALDEQICVLLNDEGKLIGLEGNLTSLTDEQLERYMALFYALRQYAEREKVRIALKLFDEKEGLSRKAIFRGLEESLRKLHGGVIIFAENYFYIAIYQKRRERSSAKSAELHGNAGKCGRLENAVGVWCNKKSKAVDRGSVKKSAGAKTACGV